MKLQLFVAAVVAAVAAWPASAIDTRFDPGKTANGGFAPATDPAYIKECGACHFAFLPGMLPARSWQAVMDRANDHFGESLSLDPTLAQRLRDYLVANAADHSDRLGPELWLRRLSGDSTPNRITSLPQFRARHFSVLYVLRARSGLNSVQPLSDAEIKLVLNCNTCHQNAETGSFAERDIVVPKVTKIVTPGGAF